MAEDHPPNNTGSSWYEIEVNNVTPETSSPPRSRWSSGSRSPEASDHAGHDRHAPIRDVVEDQ
jgi:hypothetical protein